jgi:ATP-dependent Clp protease ATP-binding subunit ClpB
VILFDEIEKAHPDVFNVLLQILDDGRLTDGQGRTVDFKNTVVIMTSNLGSQWITDPSMTEGDRRIRILDTLRTTFKPEFLNRIDDIIVFRSLTISDINRIIDIQIRLLNRRLAEKKLSIELTGEAKKQLSKAGYSATYGARPLKRSIQKMILDPLAMKLLEGGFADGDHIVVDISPSGEVSFLSPGSEPVSKKKSSKK